MGPKRYFFSGVVVLCVALAAMSAAAAGDLAARWRTVAQRAAFPVYRPLQTSASDSMAWSLPAIPGA
jgi:hypothetical protein